MEEFSGKISKGMEEQLKVLVDIRAELRRQTERIDRLERTMRERKNKEGKKENRERSRSRRR